MTNEVWAEYKGSMEYKVSVSEFLLHSTKNHFLLKPSDNDSHTPLLLHIAPNWMKFSEKKTYRSKESILQASQSRKERQKAKKRGAPAGLLPNQYKAKVVLHLAKAKARARKEARFQVRNLQQCQSQQLLQRLSQRRSQLLRGEKSLSTTTLKSTSTKPVVEGDMKNFGRLQKEKGLVRPEKGKARQEARDPLKAHTGPIGRGILHGTKDGVPPHGVRLRGVEGEVLLQRLLRLHPHWCCCNPARPVSCVL